MRKEDNEFMRTLVRGIKEKGFNLSGRIVITQPILLNSIRTYYEFRTDKAVRQRAKFLVAEGMFTLQGFNFELTEKAKKEFG